eukprot:CAMPEP_0204525036 /NCGR_PEP_ID=MMETSP0661-20131031/7693_1 /ASSEMBLY_ACC=CAM_ASM_000606 /TAXON_ID=109239 /ORGANISM="Alexandrium margalefi, Strain AMGDE01CS-322" /LENGTH=137 /DNA_ID=CAMNT_0051530817 /DNA_START=54 /DNA_END=467 /DNA_ORIENTATION=-
MEIPILMAGLGKASFAAALFLPGLHEAPPPAPDAAVSPPHPAPPPAPDAAVSPPHPAPPPAPDAAVSPPHPDSTVLHGGDEEPPPDPDAAVSHRPPHPDDASKIAVEGIFPAFGVDREHMMGVIRSSVEAISEIMKR